MKKVLLGFFGIVAVAVSVILIMYFKPIGKKVNTTTTTKTTTNTTTSKVVTTETKKYSVSFDSDGGSNISNQTVSEGSRVNKPSDPSKEGYTFLGWYLDDNEFDFNTYKVNNNVSLKAKWSVNSYTIKSVLIDKNYISGDFEYKREYGSTVKSSVEGYYSFGSYFAGWFLDGEFVTDELNVEFIMPAKDVELKAVFDPVDVEVNVVNLGDGTGTVTGTGVYKYDEKVELFATADEDSYFAGWNHYPIIPGNYYKQKYELYANDIDGVTVYVIFVKKERQYNIERYIQTLDGSYELLDTSIGYANINEMTNTEVSNIDGFTKKEIEEKQMPVHDDLTIKVYYDRNEYNLTLLVNDEVLGSVSGKEKYKYGEEVDLTVTPANGYIFKGWYIGEDLVSTNLNYGGTMPSSDLELTAVFVINEHIEYKVNHLFRLDNGTYELIESETLSGTYLEMTEAVSKIYDEYTACPFNQKVIDPSKSLSVNICYEKNKYDLRVSANDNYELIIEKQDRVVSVLSSNTYDYRTRNNYEQIYYGNMRLFNVTSGTLYNSYFSTRKTYKEWQDFYDNPTLNLDYPYFIDENGFYNPSFYTSNNGTLFNYSSVEDLDSVSGRIHNYICNYLHENYYDSILGQYHFSTTDGEFYFGRNIDKCFKLDKIDYENLGEIIFKIEISGILLGDIEAYDEFNAVSNYSSSLETITLPIKVSYDEVYERFITNSDISFTYYIFNGSSYEAYDNTDYGHIHKEKNYYEYNENVTLSATPSEGYHFVGWYEDDTLLSDSLEYSFKMKNHNMAIRAIFKPDVIYTIDVENSDELYFGSYPKTIVDDKDLISYLNTHISVMPTISEPNGWTKYSYTYHSDNSACDSVYHYSIDLNNDGMNDYMAVALYDSRTNEISETLIWVKYEPIKWTILKEEDGKAMIISDLIIDAQNFNSKGNSNIYEHNGGEGYSNNYELSDVRLWLNSCFYDMAFNDFEKEKIQTVEVNNGVETTDNINEKYICNNTFDKVFLLSYKEAIEYFPTNSLREVKYSDYVIVRGIAKTISGTTTWILRSPGNSDSYIYAINYIGQVATSSKVNAAFHGIRPVIWIEL